MKFEITKEEGLKKRIEITESAEESERARISILREKAKVVEAQVYRKGVNVPNYFSGYRKGHLPAHVIEKYIGGKSLCYNSFFNRLYQGFVKEFDSKVAYLFPMTDENIVCFEPFAETKIVVELEVYPEIKDFEYYDMDIPSGDAEPTKEDIKAAMKMFLENNKVFAESKRKVVESGDAMYVSFQGRAFLENGTEKGVEKAENILIALGDKKYIEGATSFLPFFERNLVGKKLGENEVRFVLPDKGVDKELQNAEIKLEVLIHKVGKMTEPEITDEYVNEISKGKTKTVEEFKKDFEALVRKRKTARVEQEKEEKIFSCLLSRAGEFELPGSMIERQTMSMVSDRLASLSKGKPVDEFVKENDIKIEEFKKPFVKEATALAKKKMIFRVIAEKENFKVDDKHIKNEIETNEAYWRKSGEKVIKPSVDQVKKALKSSNKFQDFCDDLTAKEILERIKSKVVKKESTKEGKKDETENSES